MAKWINYLHFIVLFSFVFSLMSISHTVQADVQNNQVNESLEYLEEEVTWEKFDDFDIEKAEKHIKILTETLKNENEVDSLLEYSIRKLRARSFYQINIKRQEEDVNIDIEQVEQAKVDFDYVISWAKNPSEFMWEAAQNALHLLDSTTLAYEYWEKCAQLNHGACMNTLAYGTFTGKYGVPINLSKSIFWHNKVAETKLEFTCAGLFSINILMQTTAFMKEVDTGDTWRGWQKKRDELTAKIIEEKIIEESYPCNSAAYPIVDYILLRTEGVEDTTLLDKGIELLEGELLIKIVNVMKEGKDAALALEFLSQLEEGEGCGVTLYLALYAKYNEQTEAFSQINDYMTTMHSCSWELSVKAHMQTEGSW